MTLGIRSGFCVGWQEWNLRRSSPWLSFRWRAKLTPVRTWNARWHTFEKRQHEAQNLFACRNFFALSISVSKKTLPFSILPSPCPDRRLMHWERSLRRQARWLWHPSSSAGLRECTTTALRCSTQPESWRDFIARCTFRTILLTTKSITSLRGIWAFNRSRLAWVTWVR